MESVRILVADDHELVCAGLVRVLRESHPEWEVVGEAGTGEAAVQLAMRLNPNVAILDLAMPDMTGLDVARQLQAGVPGILILILTRHAAAPILEQLRDAGINAYLAKTEAAEYLVKAVEDMVAGAPFFASGSAYRRRSDLEPMEFVPSQFLLTARELEVLRLIARGNPSKLVAAELGISVRTAEAHRARIFDKLDVDTLGQLVRIAARDHVI